MVGLHDTGEEFILDYVFTDGATRPSDISIGLYNDSTDTLSDSGDYSDITTEPTGSAYTQQTASFPGDFTNSQNASDNWQTVIADQTFDVSDSSQDVDGFYVTISYTSDTTGDSGSNEHLLFTANLDQTYDLGSVDTFTLKNAGVSID